MPKHADLVREATKRYFDRIDQLDPPVRPDSTPLSYETCPRIERVKWRTPFAEHQVRHELQEVTNGLNRWWGSLRRWNAWVDVLDSFSGDEAWLIQWEFAESVAFHCMFQPSATRDGLTLATTNAVHQALLTDDASYQDRLDGEEIHEDGRQKILSRKRAERRLADLILRFTSNSDYLEALQRLDGPHYRESTANFRNQASHAIAPRFAIGFKKIVGRTLKLGPNPYAPSTASHGRNAFHVQYEFGGTPPISMRGAFEATLIEFKHALETFAAYQQLLCGILERLPLA